MDLTKITSSDFQKIAKLLEKKETLLNQVEELNRQLESIGGGIGGDAGPVRAIRRPAAVGVGARLPRRKPGGRAPRGQTKEAIIQALKNAGRDGMTVKDLTEHLGSNYKSTYVWFQTTGKRMKEIKKVGPAKFAWVG